MIAFSISSIVVLHLGDGENDPAEYLFSLINCLKTIQDVFHPKALPEIIVSYEGKNKLSFAGIENDNNDIKTQLENFDIFDGKCTITQNPPEKVSDFLTKLKIKELKSEKDPKQVKESNIWNEIQNRVLEKLNNSYAVLEEYLKYLTKERNIINSPYLNSWRSKADINGIIEYQLPMIKPSKCLIFNTLEAESLNDILFVPKDDYTCQIIVSFSAMEKMRAKTSLILGNPKAQRMLHNFCKNHGHVFMYIVNAAGSDSIPPILLQLAIYMSELMVVLSDCQKGDYLKKEIIKLKKSFTWPRQKVLTIMENFEKTSKEPMKEIVMKDIEGKNESNLIDALFNPFESCFVYTENLLNIHYIFGSQLFCDFPNYYEKLNCIQPYAHQIEDSFEAFLRRSVTQFLPVSPWKKMVYI